LFFALDPFTAFGSVTAALAALLGAYATYLGKRNEGKSANREETQQAFALQQLAMENQERDNEKLRARAETMHDKLNEAYGKIAVLATQHQQCLDREVRTAERVALLERQVAQLDRRDTGSD
jgi:acetyl-CoA carboxylase carboxyltransferase component